MRMRSHRLLRRGEDAQTVVVGAFVALAVLGILAVSFDIGTAWVNRRNLQNVADAAALAGAQSLTGDSSGNAAAEADALDYVADNGVPAAGATAAAANTEITVVVNKNTNRIIAGALGLGDTTITARAKARIASPLLPGPGVVPLAIDLANYNLCVQGNQCTGVTLKEFSGNNEVPRRNYGFLDMGGNGGGTNEICNYITGGSTVPITDPDLAEPGNKNGMRDCLGARMTAAAGTGSSHPQPCVTLNDVLEYANGPLRWECNPLGGAFRGADTAYPNAQPTAVIIIPVVQDFNEGGCGTPNNCVDLIGSGDQLRTFAFFLIDRTTVQTVNGVGPTCANNGQCWITGQFLRTWMAPVSTRFDLPTGNWDPNALLKIVQLVE